ncbi:Os04g0127750, partial [Oryza sativa Japonica Group]
TYRRVAGHFCHARKFTSNFRTNLCIKSSSRNQPRYTN